MGKTVKATGRIAKFDPARYNPGWAGSIDARSPAAVCMDLTPEDLDEFNHAMLDGLAYGKIVTVTIVVGYVEGEV